MNKQKYKITQSLLSAWIYIDDTYDTDSAYKDFLKCLRRERIDQNEAMKLGNEFEESVYRYTQGQIAYDKRFGNTDAEAGEIVKHGQYQVNIFKEKAVDDILFLLQARLDFLKAGTVYDIKYSGTYYAGKYLNSPQHPMYFECVPSANEFVYLISDGSTLYQERYLRRETIPIEQTIRQFMGYLRASGLLDTYFKHWRM